MKSEYGLALGGGAARGFMHIGVIKYLEEIGHKPCEISGTSMGSVIAAFVALGFTSKEIIKTIKKIRWLGLVDIRIRGGFLKGDRIYRILQKIFGDKEFKDTIIPLRIIGANITTGEKHIFESGKIADAVRASISIPGVFKPFRYEGSLFVDGGVLENLPLSGIKSQNILAISTRRHLGDDAKNLDCDKKRISSIEVIKRTMLLFQEANEKLVLMNNQNKNVIHIKMPNKFGYADFKKINKMIEIGYNTSKQALEKTSLMFK